MAAPGHDGQTGADGPASDVTTLCEAFQTTAARDPQAIALRSHDGRTELTWADYAREVRELAAGLAGLGVTRGSTVGILLPTGSSLNPVVEIKESAGGDRVDQVPELGGRVLVRPGPPPALQGGGRGEPGADRA
jgi:hypothetical protein